MIIMKMTLSHMTTLNDIMGVHHENGVAHDDMIHCLSSMFMTHQSSFLFALTLKMTFMM